jgi:hypothetical protein
MIGTAPLIDPWFDAGFIRDAQEDGGYRVHHENGEPIKFSEAQGLYLWCPCGYGARDKDGSLEFPLDLSLNHGRPHGLLIPFSNPPSGIAVPANFGPVDKNTGTTHPRWQVVSGSGLSDLTLAPSIDVGKPSCWHGFIQSGVVK